MTLVGDREETGRQFDLEWRCLCMAFRKRGMMREVRVLGRDYEGELVLTCQYEREETLYCAWEK
jgi:hypothetical protein